MASKLQSPPVTCVQINEKCGLLVNSVKNIMSKAVPKEEKKEEEKKEEEKKEGDEEKKEGEEKKEEAYEDVKMEVE